VLRRFAQGPGPGEDQGAGAGKLRGEGRARGRDDRAGAQRDGEAGQELCRAYLRGGGARVFAAAGRAERREPEGGGEGVAGDRGVFEGEYEVRREGRGSGEKRDSVLVRHERGMRLRMGDWRVVVRNERGS